MEVDRRGPLAGKPERALVADEMHLVPAPGQLFAQRRGEDAAAADRRVAGDADPERAARVHVQKRRAPRPELRQRIDDERVVGIESDGVPDAGAQAVQPGARQLHLDVRASGTLRRVRLHGGGPGGRGPPGRRRRRGWA